MKIIKEGVNPVYAKLFECPDCHCIFEAERGEYTTRTEEFMGTEYHAVCPFCGRTGYMIIKSWEYPKESERPEIKFEFGNMPAKSGTYLVYGSEYDLFDGDYGEPRYMIIGYSEKWESWDTKMNINVLAWAKLPDKVLVPKEVSADEEPGQAETHGAL